MKTPTPTWKEAIDEILDTFRSEIDDQPKEATSWEWEGVFKRHNKAQTQAKAAITSVLKDLVAEAKPDPVKPIRSVFDAKCMDCGKWQHYENPIRPDREAINQFEYNLLKLLDSGMK